MKKSILILVFSFFIFANNGFAHTGLESASPADGEVVIEELNQVSLTFETKIEQGSTVALLDSEGKEVALESVEVVDNQLIGHLSSPLKDSEYDVKWEIIGADGHVIDGEYSFTVNTPTIEENVEEQEMTTQNTENEGANDNEEVVDHSQHSAEEHAAYLAANNNPSTVLVPALIILGLIIVGIIVVGVIVIRKQKK
ncbi:hypothetical protein CHI02_19825 [Niallia circulans]|uniref:copper resistance CopC family protein n=1 Tax=Niallia circulans TaxID=1397 RepID=UPI000BA569C2|nr:copper resistance CopC family protein [Niallia circulans]PAE10434.1 hypothetical protein CHI02_19825 [Niallia circulans]